MLIDQGLRGLEREHLLFKIRSLLNVHQCYISSRTELRALAVDSPGGHLPDEGCQQERY